MLAELVLFNGEVISVDENFTIYSAVAVKDDTIVKLGEDEEIKKMITDSTIAIDLKGMALLPGFIDSHVHFTQTGLDEMNMNASDFSTMDEFFKGLEQFAKDMEIDRWVIAVGFDEGKISDGRLPTRKDLDRLSISNPVFISRVDAHSCAVNSKALELLSIDERSEGYDKDENGEAQGTFRAKANGLARVKLADFITDDERRTALHLAAKQALNRGVTTIHALEGGSLFSDKDIAVIKEEKDKLPVNIEIFHQTMDVDKVKEEGFNRIGGCVIIDGSIGSFTAAFEEPYVDPPDSRGCLYYTDEQVDMFVARAHGEGMQISTHCIGDRAIEQMLKAYEKCISGKERRDHRHRIEHFSIPTDGQINRAAQLGLVISTQPVFNLYDKDSMYEKRLGKERASRALPLNTMIEKGILVAGGSDSPVTPINPLLGMHAAVNHSNKRERISIKEAIKLFTINGAKAVFQEDKRGSLEAGKKADIVMLNKNPLKTDKRLIKDIEVLMTIVNGRIQYSRLIP